MRGFSAKEVVSRKAQGAFLRESACFAQIAERVLRESAGFAQPPNVPLRESASFARVERPSSGGAGGPQILEDSPEVFPPGWRKRFRGVSQRCRAPPRTLPGASQGQMVFPRVIPGCFPIRFRVLPATQGVSRGCFPRVFPGCFPRVFPGCFRGVSGCFRGVSQGDSGGVSQGGKHPAGCFRGVSGGVSGNFQVVQIVGCKTCAKPVLSRRPATVTTA